MEVATLVREAGVEIGINPEEPLIDEIIAKLKKEFIVHDWQVAKLDSAQWQILGAPMGLSVAIQAMIEEEQEMNMPPYKAHYKNHEPERFSSSLTSRSSLAIQENDQLTNSTRSNGSMGAIRKNPRKSRAKPSLFNRHATLQVMEGKNPVEGALDEETEEANDGSGMLGRENTSPQEQLRDPVEPQKGSTCNLNNKGCCGKEVATCFHSMMKTELTVENTSCFVMSKLFDQALLHSKTGVDLKAHTMFVIELSVVASALFLGAAIELWGAFPLDAVTEDYFVHGGVPQALAFAYNLTSALLIISQLLCASAWIWSLRVISAVASNKFHQYTVETRHFADYINSMSMFGFALFALDLFLLLAGMSLATTDNWIVNGVALGVAFLVFITGAIAVQKIGSFVGRVAYHGMLMTSQDPNPSTPLADKPEESHFKEREDMLHRTFERNAILHESKALDAYSRTCNPEFCALYDNGH
eukprot:CAMPEP_0113643588 /NCGR_PEP_ID=MMETSP0017_2-20120614/22926_1 /TAXON_ID=2856 /ORGANISM="Cylindrotheca closterium" /LENGTH=470 /DNA_ID=CAMNT_0000555125 /DNA_START=358 /DNA_END=1770 /DNA_ORIENTATION=+ /assembly_acc=CAM_ASM_000147